MDILNGLRGVRKMYKIGMFGGTFNPLHLGHINNIVEASNMSEKLYVILFYSESLEEIDHRIRFGWLKQVTKDMPNVVVLEIKDESKSKNEYDWETGRDDVLKVTGEIDAVFCGDDYRGTNRFEELYPKSIVHYFNRKLINISSTEIRQNPYVYFEYIPSVVKEYFTKKVIVVGTESCGKSTLVRNLAKVYNTAYVEEVGRDICDEAGGLYNMQTKHYEEIIYKHKCLEKEQLKKANKILFVDTDALITLYYYKLSFEETEDYDKSFEQLAQAVSKLNHYDLWLYLEPDVTWVQDGTRTFGEEEIRQKNNAILKSMLSKMKIKYETINGNYQERFVKARKLIDKLIN